MLNEDYLIYMPIKAGSSIFKDVPFHELSLNHKKCILILYEFAKDNYKKFILILNECTHSIILRVYSTGENSKKFVDVICSYQFILDTDFIIMSNVIKDDVKFAIEKTLEEMKT